MKERLDKLLQDKGIVDTRSKAKTIIEKGLVEVNGKLAKKAGEKVNVQSDINILTDKIYVSRAAYKMVEAIKTFSPELEGRIAADVGASTGGFTQVLLEAGVSKVYAIDVGHDQLNPILKDDERVINQEGINIKFPHQLPEKVDLAVTDLSFISLRLVFDNIWNLVKEDGFVIALIKPQFEAGRERMGKDAVIRDDHLRQEILDEVLSWFDDNGYKYQAVIDSPITGKDGNYEYLCLINSKE